MRCRAAAGKAHPSPRHGKRGPRPASAALFAQLISRAGNCPATRIYGSRRAPRRPLRAYPRARFPVLTRPALAPSLPPHPGCPLPAPLPRPRPEGSEPFGPRGCPLPAGGGRCSGGRLPGAAALLRPGGRRAPGCAGSGGGGGGECGVSPVPRGAGSPPGRQDGKRCWGPAGMGRGSFWGTQSLGCSQPSLFFGILLREFVPPPPPRAPPLRSLRTADGRGRRGPPLPPGSEGPRSSKRRGSLIPV